MKYKGTLIPIGGNEDKGSGINESYTLEFITEGILASVVQESGGLDARIVIIPTASSIPEEVGEMYISAFTELGCTNLKVLDIREREQCEDPKTIKEIKEANCIMFSGGDQSRISDIIGGTIIHEILHTRFIEEEIVIAGTSAGAMAMSTEMIYGGSSTDALIKGSIRMREGLGFIDDLIIDSHFIMRGRFGRLAEAVANHPTLIGVGLAEDTGMIIKDRNACRVIGSGMVIIFDANNLSQNNVASLPVGVPMTMAGIKVHVLANYDVYHIDTRSVEVLPFDVED